MHHVVEIRHFGADLAAARAELQDWLSKHAIRPVSFEHSTGGPGITFRLQFAAESEAEQLAAAFHGWRNNAHPVDPPRWEMRERRATRRTAKA